MYNLNLKVFLCKITLIVKAHFIISLHVAPTAPPASLTGFSLGSDSILLSWDAPLLSERNGRIQYYLVNVTEQETGNTFGHVSLRTNFTLFGLHPYYNYRVTTTAVTVGPGPSTSPVVITTDQDGEKVFDLCGGVT